ncbi:MAG: hypothetical protein MHPSP_002134, partial [Paramarteilia canceri]
MQDKLSALKLKLIESNKKEIQDKENLKQRIEALMEQIKIQKNRSNALLGADRQDTIKKQEVYILECKDIVEDINEAITVVNNKIMHDE